MVHADKAEAAGCSCADGTCDPPELDHPPHLCLACSRRILRDEPEIKVKMKYGRFRYRHADDVLCQNAMARDFGSRFLQGGKAGGRR